MMNQSPCRVPLAYADITFCKQAGTSGCTVEAAQFREHQEEFDGLGAKVVGISGDSPKDLDMFQ